MLSAGRELAEVAQAEPKRVHSKQQQAPRMTCKNEHRAEAPPRTRCKNVERGYLRQRETLVPWPHCEGDTRNERKQLLCPKPCLRTRGRWSMP